MSRLEKIVESPASAPTTEYLSPSVLDPALYEKLVKIRHALEEIFHRPVLRGHCSDVATFVELETGLSRLYGYYPRPGCEDFWRGVHHYNRTENQRFNIDLTLDQFDPNAPPVAIYPATVQLIQDIPLHWYREFRINPADGFCRPWPLEPGFIEKVRNVMKANLTKT